MGQKYIQLNGQERFDIAHLRSNRISIRQIAAAVDRAPSTVAREIKRNCNRNGSYTPMYADQQSRARRWSGSMLDRDRELRQTVVIALLIGWSPQQIAGRLARDARGPMISHETIYRFIYAQITRTNDYSWRRLLPRGKFKRGRRNHKGGSSVKTFAHRRPLSERPDAANDVRHQDTEKRT